MPQAEGGKFCGQCSQVVIDFTRMTDAQLIDWMRSYRGGCGTFRPDQLNRDLIEPVVRKAPFGIQWLLSILILTGCMRDEGAKKGERKLPGTEQHINLEDSAMKAETPPPVAAAQLDAGRSRSRNDIASHAEKKRHGAEKRPAVVDGIIEGEVTGGIPVQADPRQFTTDTLNKRIYDASARNGSEFNGLSTAGVYSPVAQRSGDGLTISGARTTGTRLIIDGVQQVQPVKKNFWQRVFGRR